MLLSTILILVACLTDFRNVFGMTTIPPYGWLIAIGGSLATLAGDEYMKSHFRARSETKRRFREVRETVDTVAVSVHALAAQITRLEASLQEMREANANKGS